MADENILPRDQNRVTAAGFVSSSDATLVLPGQIDQATGKILVTETAGGVIGPVSSTDNAVARWNGTTGETLQNSTTVINDSGHVSINGSADFTAPLSIKGGSDYGQVELINTAGTKIGGYGIADTDDQIVVGSAAGNLALWNGQGIDFSTTAGSSVAASMTTGGDFTLPTAATGVILTSDNGTQFRVHVSNVGVLVVTAI